MPNTHYSYLCLISSPGIPVVFCTPADYVPGITQLAPQRSFEGADHFQTSYSSKPAYPTPTATATRTLPPHAMTTTTGRGARSGTIVNGSLPFPENPTLRQLHHREIQPGMPCGSDKCHLTTITTTTYYHYSTKRNKGGALLTCAPDAILQVSHRSRDPPVPCRQHSPGGQR